MKGSCHIAIVGGSGSGKTCLAEELCQTFSNQATRLSLDDFYLDLSHVDTSERGLTNFDDPATIDWVAARRVMDGLTSGVAVQIPIYDFSTHTRQKATRSLTPPPLVIWDGLWLLHHSEMRNRFAYSVFVECDARTRLARRIERDVQQRGRTEDSVHRQFDQHVQPMHQQFVEHQRNLASRIVQSPLSLEVWNELVNSIRELSAAR